jgi:hypothetical protein
MFLSKIFFPTASTWNLSGLACILFTLNQLIRTFDSNSKTEVSTLKSGFYGVSLLKQQLSRKHDAYLVSLVCPNFSNLFLLVLILYLENVVIYHGHSAKLYKVPFFTK